MVNFLCRPSCKVTVNALQLNELSQPTDILETYPIKIWNLSIVKKCGRLYAMK